MKMHHLQIVKTHMIYQYQMIQLILLKNKLKYIINLQEVTLIKLAMELKTLFTDYQRHGKNQTVPLLKI